MFPYARLSISVNNTKRSLVLIPTKWQLSFMMSHIAVREPKLTPEEATILLTKFEAFCFCKMKTII
jgi:hypothetical protein